MKETQNITIRIADVAPISMTIRRDTEERVREAERSVNRVWRTWRAEFEGKTSKEILAMVSVQFARLYFELQSRVDESQKVLGDFEGELDRLLELTNEPEPSPAPTPSRRKRLSQR